MTGIIVLWTEECIRFSMMGKFGECTSRSAECIQTEEKEKWTICGALCTANDVLVRDIELTALGEGSVIIFENAGAYAMTEGMSLFLSHELPAVVFYSEKEGFKLARNKQETYKWNMEDHK